MTITCICNFLFLGMKAKQMITVSRENVARMLNAKAAGEFYLKFGKHI